MPSTLNFSQYPRLKKLMEETGMTLDQAHDFVLKKCKEAGIE